MNIFSAVLEVYANFSERMRVLSCVTPIFLLSFSISDYLPYLPLCSAPDVLYLHSKAFPSYWLQ